MTLKKKKTTHKNQTKTAQHVSSTVSSTHHKKIQAFLSLFYGCLDISYVSMSQNSLASASEQKSLLLFKGNQHSLGLR